MSSFDRHGKDLNQALDDYLRGKYLPAGLITVLLLLGSLIGFAHNTSPAPFIPQMIDFFGLDPVADQSLINLSLSIIFASTIPAQLLGAVLESRIGTRRLFTLAMFFTAVGVLMIFLPFDQYGVFLVGRIVYGFGFGLNIPALGSAFMKWFRPRGRQMMVTLNGVLPLLGALVSYTSLPLVADAFGGADGMSGGWQFGYGFTGIVVAVIFVVWVVGVRKSTDAIDISAEEDRISGIAGPVQVGKGENPFAWNFKTNQIKCLLAAFICDFIMYMYIATILPIWLINAGHMSDVTANFWTAIAFPVFGVAGTILGGVIMNLTNSRKPIILFCQCLKLSGFVVACFGADYSPVWIIAGVALFGLGNGGWMPPMFLMPTEIKGADATKVATSFSLLLGSGYAAGLISPVVGGALSTALIDSFGIQGEAAQLSFGLKWSVFYLGLSHLVAIFFAIKLKETGPRAALKA